MFGFFRELLESSIEYYNDVMCFHAIISHVKVITEYQLFKELKFKYTHNSLSQNLKIST